MNAKLVWVSKEGVAPEPSAFLRASLDWSEGEVERFLASKPKALEAVLGLLEPGFRVSKRVPVLRQVGDIDLLVSGKVGSRVERVFAIELKVGGSPMSAALQVVKNTHGDRHGLSGLLNVRPAAMRAVVIGPFGRDALPKMTLSKEVRELLDFRQPKLVRFRPYVLPGEGSAEGTIVLAFAAGKAPFPKAKSATPKDNELLQAARAGLRLPGTREAHKTLRRKLTVMAGSDPVGFRLRVTLKAKKKEQLLSAPSLNSISSQTIRAFLRVLEMEVPPGWTREGPRIGQQAEVTFRANASVGAKQVKRFSGQLWSAVSRG